MFAKLKHHIVQGRKVAAIGFCLAGLIVAGSVRGWFEPLELGLLDRFFVLRARTSVVNDHILVVSIDERDIANLGQWPISDRTLSQVVRRIDAHGPASIGLDLYRNFLVEPGSEELIETFDSIPNIVGAERVLEGGVESHKTLSDSDRTASIDLVVDNDGRVRRGLLSVISPEGEVKKGLATTLALDYLSERNIHLETSSGERKGTTLRLGKTTITRFERNDGGYVNADSGGYQVLMNYRGRHAQFEAISLTAVLDGKLTDEMVRDRIVLIGSTAISLNDFFYTPPEKHHQVAGVYIHAHLTSQLINAALKGQSFLRTVPDYVEWLWTLFWVSLSLTVSGSILYGKSVKSALPVWYLFVYLSGVCSGLVCGSYALFLMGWWLPTVLPSVAVLSTAVLGVVLRNAQLQNLAAFDELTQVANRRYFDQYLERELKTCKHLSLILCDIDYFKGFNDFYGHPAGDRCLHQVAQSLKQSVRNDDLVARYGGEEFVIVLPNTTEETAKSIGNRIQQQIQSLGIVHERSKVSDFVTMSFGLASVNSHSIIEPRVLIECADKALYKAKHTGRNRLVVSRWETSSQIEIDSNEAA
ncbi:MAG: CHASE2 domain-containing protein [Cyanobacteria bacterium J06649_4]